MAKLGQAGTTMVGLDCLTWHVRHTVEASDSHTTSTRRRSWHLRPSRPRTGSRGQARARSQAQGGAGHRAGAGREEFWQRFRNATGRPARAERRGDSHRFVGSRYGARIGGYPRAASWRSTAPNHPVRPRSHCMWWPMPRRRARGGYIDAEHALDPAYARKLGVDTDSLIVSQPDNGEQALEIADMLIRSGALDVIVIDSVAALVPRRNRRRNGRQPCWFAGPTHESGAAQDDRRVGSGRHHRHLHQPAA